MAGKITIRHACRVNTVRFSPDGYHLVTTSYCGTAKIWGLADGQWQEEASIQHNSWVLIASFSPDGYHLVTASDDDTAKIWGLLTGNGRKKPPSNMLTGFTVPASVPTEIAL